jgi:putative flippase GtrA
MSLARQSRHYLLIGGLQWAVDCTLMVALTHAGMAMWPANTLGRIAGAMLGYWLNGKLTFASDNTAVGRTQLLRFIMLWLCTTIASNLSMSAIDRYLGLQWAWLAKPAVELALGAIGFLMSRHWVYRR